MWTRYAIRMLLDAYEEYKNVQSKHQKWINIKEYLEHKNEQYTIKQIQTKFKNFKKMYNAAKERMDTSGQSHSTFEHYERMDEIFGIREEGIGQGEVIEVSMVEGQDYTVEWALDEEELETIEENIQLEETQNISPVPLPVTNGNSTTRDRSHPSSSATISRSRRRKPKTNIDKFLEFKEKESVRKPERHIELMNKFDKLTDAINNYAEALRDQRE